MLVDLDHIDTTNSVLLWQDNQLPQSEPPRGTRTRSGRDLRKPRQLPHLALPLHPKLNYGGVFIQTPVGELSLGKIYNIA